MINNNESKASICRMLKCKPETLEGYLKKLNIIYKGNIGLKGKKTSLKRKTALKYLEKTTPTSSKLRKKLIEDKIKEEKCEKCKNIEWMGEKISLELHHKDGNRFNNNLHNLEILCPNCHSLTPNHSHRKITIKKQKNQKKEIKTNFCQCGKPIKKRSKYCIKCYRLKRRKTERPEINDLINDVNSLGYVGTGKKYGVSDNSIRKWVKSNSVS